MSIRDYPLQLRKSGAEKTDPHSKTFICTSSDSTSCQKDFQRRLHPPIVSCRKIAGKSFDLPIFPCLRVMAVKMPSIEAMGEGLNAIYIIFTHRSDFEALDNRMNIYLTPTKAAQLLEDCNSSACGNSFFHTCALSVVGDRTFGDIMSFVRALFCRVASSSSSTVPWY